MARGSQSLIRRLVLALVCCAGCGDERAVYVDVSTTVRTDQLCVVAHGGGRVVFSQAYTGGQAAGGTLTFVAGSEVDEQVQLTATAYLGGAEVARATVEVSFADELVEQPLHPARCVPRARRLATLSLEMVAQLSGTPSGAVAADVDGDGREEIVVSLGSDLVAIDAERGGGSHGLDAAGATGVPGASGDLDGDCAPDVVLAGGPATVVLDPEGSASARMLGDDAAGVGVGSVGPARTAGLAIAGAGGVSIAGFDGGAPVMLRAGIGRSIAVTDLTGDGASDVIASGDFGGAAWIAGDTGLAEVAGTLPASFASVTGPIAAGDLDGDGAPDLAGAGGMETREVRLAHNRGDGLLEDRSGGAPAMAAMAIAQIRIGDVDGDCRGDVLVVDAGGNASMWRSGIDLALEPFELGARATGAAALLAADVDGDGPRELVLVSQTGEVHAWLP